MGKYPHIWLDHYEKRLGVLKTLLFRTPVYWAFISVAVAVLFVQVAVVTVVRYAV